MANQGGVAQPPLAQPNDNDGNGNGSGSDHGPQRMYVPGDVLPLNALECPASLTLIVGKNGVLRVRNNAEDDAEVTVTVPDYQVLRFVEAGTEVVPKGESFDFLLRARAPFDGHVCTVEMEVGEYQPVVKNVIVSAIYHS